MVDSLKMETLEDVQRQRHQDLCKHNKCELCATSGIESLIVPREVVCAYVCKLLALMICDLMWDFKFSYPEAIFALLKQQKLNDPNGVINVRNRGNLLAMRIASYKFHVPSNYLDRDYLCSCVYEMIMEQGQWVCKQYELVKILLIYFTKPPHRLPVEIWEMICEMPEAGLRFSAGLE